ncbi:hypothetical protein [Streptomyces capitiformicae]|uniref:Uncharacterized protein n=1 Tax=Streptomyces capitiformicae TaxID=2014920 RepID=A0A919GCT3_9ACTN|nr:hypothetical protein [Streptomyces capitiformicae]GHH81661.1 hypothetical protein GCM10017771_04140 [Streptomyces capitiformicae]
MTDIPVMANPNTLSDRAAMGLPDSYVTRTDPWPLRDHRDLLSVLAETLVAVAEDPSCPSRAGTWRAPASAWSAIRASAPTPRPWPTSPPPASGSACRRTESAGSPRAGGTPG